MHFSFGKLTLENHGPSIIVLQSRYVNRGRSFTPTTSYTTSTKNNTHLEKQVAVNFQSTLPPKTSHSSLKKWYFPMFSRHWFILYEYIEVFFQLQKLFQQTLEPWKIPPALTHRKFSTQPMCRPVRPRRALVIRGIANFVRWFWWFFWGGTQQWRWLGWIFLSLLGWGGRDKRFRSDLDVIHQMNSTKISSRFVTFWMTIF